MALITCPKCTKQISTHAAAYPHCGYPMQAIANVQTMPPTPQLRNCLDCGGSGSQREECGMCHGAGVLICEGCRGSGRCWDGVRFEICIGCHGRASEPCTFCASIGYNMKKCTTCAGSGQLIFEKFDALQRIRTEAAKQKAEADASHKDEVAAQAKNCAEAEAKREQEEISFDAEGYARFIANAPKRAAEEAKRKVEEEARKEEQRREQEKKAEEERIQIQEARFTVGCCMNCGLRLGVVDRVLGMKYHPACTEYKPKQAWESTTMIYCRECKCAVSFHILINQASNTAYGQFDDYYVCGRARHRWVMYR